MLGRKKKKQINQRSETSSLPNQVQRIGLRLKFSSLNHPKLFVHCLSEVSVLVVVSSILGLVQKVEYSGLVEETNNITRTN